MPDPMIPAPTTPTVLISMSTFLILSGEELFHGATKDLDAYFQRRFIKVEPGRVMRIREFSFLIGCSDKEETTGVFVEEKRHVFSTHRLGVHDDILLADNFGRDLSDELRHLFMIDGGWRHFVVFPFIARAHGVTGASDHALDPMWKLISQVGIEI